MTRSEASALLSAVRRAGDELAKGLAQLRTSSPNDLRTWELATARALGAIHKELLEPILTEHPEITPAELGGPR
jgi:hypothetical protein